MKGINPYFIVEDVIYDYIVTDGALFNVDTKAYRMAAELFDDELSSSMDKTYKELDEELKLYSNLTVVNGKIRLGPGNKKNINAFIQWTRDQIRLGLNPSLTRFPVVDSLDYIKRYNHQSAYIKNSKTIIETAKPEDLTNKVKWIEW